MDTLNPKSLKPLAPTPIWLAVRLPFLPLEAWGIAADVDAHILVSHNHRVISASQISLREINLGVPTSTAQMMLNGKLIDNDGAKNQALLNKLMGCVYQFTPHYELYDKNTILLEISSCIKLFKTPTNLLQQLLEALQQCFQVYCTRVEAEGQITQSLSIELGVAHTRLGAWLLSFKQLPAVFDELPQRSFEALSACELDGLTQYPKVVEQLKKTGFITLGDLFLQNGYELRERYGPLFIDFIGDIFGVDISKTPSPDQPPQQAVKNTSLRPTEAPEQAFIERFDLDSPTSSLTELQNVFECLLLRLQHYLKKRQKQCDKVRWRLYSIHRQESVHVLNIPGLHSQWAFALELTRLHFEHTELPFEVDTVVLDCAQLSSLVAATPSLFGASGDSQDEQKLLTKLSAKLGKSAIFTLQYVDSHIPELSTQKVVASTQSSRSKSNVSLPSSGDRPTWLLRIPQRLRHSHQGLFYKGKLRLLAGPERIQQLWESEPIWRDYFIAMQEDATRLWVFKDLRDQQWYLHGLF